MVAFMTKLEICNKYSINDVISKKIEEQGFFHCMLAETDNTSFWCWPMKWTCRYDAWFITFECTIRKPMHGIIMMILLVIDNPTSWQHRRHTHMFSAQFFRSMSNLSWIWTRRWFFLFNCVASRGLRGTHWTTERRVMGSPHQNPWRLTPHIITGESSYPNDWPNIAKPLCTEVA